MTTRPYKLRFMPALGGEIKNGMKKPGSHRGTSIDYWRIVRREREADGNNFRKMTDVHEALGEEEPRNIPITLLSDDPEECLPAFRGWFAGPHDNVKTEKSEYGKLRCGAPYKARSQDDLIEAYFRTDNGDEIPEKAVEKDDDGYYAETNSGKRIDLEKREVIRADRRINVQTGSGKLKGNPGEFVDSFDAPCHKQCPIWQNGDCQVQSTLYFQLGGELPHNNELFVYRASGVYAQRTLMSTLRMIHNITDGVMAGIPLELAFRQELKQTPRGRKPVPMPAITMPGSYQELMHEVDRELDRRRNRFMRKYPDQAPGISDLKVVGTLEHMHGRSALEEVGSASENRDAPDPSEKKPEIDIPTSIKTKFNQLGYARRKQQLVLDRFTDEGELNTDELSAFLEQEVERKLDMDDYQEDDDAESDPFGF